MLNETTIIALILGPIIILIVGRIFSKNKEKDVSFQFLDLSVLSMAFFIILSRIEGIVLNHDKFSSIGWYLMPINQPGDQLQLFGDWPWVFFRFWDGHFFFAEAISAFLIAWLWSNFLSRKLRIEKERMSLLKFGFVAHSLAFIPLAIVAAFNGFNSGAFSISMPIVFLFCQISAAFAGYLFLDKGTKIWTLSILVLQVVITLIINLTALIEKNNLMGINIIYGLTILINLIALLKDRSGKPEQTNPDLTTKRTVNYRARNYSTGRVHYDIYR